MFISYTLLPWHYLIDDGINPLTKSTQSISFSLNSRCSSLIYIYIILLSPNGDRLIHCMRSYLKHKKIYVNVYYKLDIHIDGGNLTSDKCQTMMTDSDMDELMQERHNSSALELELHLSCFNPSICDLTLQTSSPLYSVMVLHAMNKFQWYP